MIWLCLMLVIVTVLMCLPEAKPLKEEKCDWCKTDWEVCGTCQEYFSNSGGCAADPKECGCAYYRPFGFCPKCGRKLREGA